MIQPSTSTVTANLNQSQCVVEKYHIGKSAFHNICTGAVTEVLWNPADWAGLVIAVLASFFILLMFTKIFTTRRSVGVHFK